jgi:hypothetical protein
MEKKLAIMNEMLQERSAALSGAEVEVERLKELLTSRTAPIVQVVRQLRAPMASIQNCLDVVLSGYSTIPTFELEGMLHLARDRARGSLGLVNDLHYSAWVAYDMPK